MSPLGGREFLFCSRGNNQSRQAREEDTVIRMSKEEPNMRCMEPVHVREAQLELSEQRGKEKKERAVGKEHCQET